MSPLFLSRKCGWKRPGRWQPLENAEEEAQAEAAGAAIHAPHARI
jgi:hypothetical protein